MSARSQEHGQIRTTPLPKQPAAPGARFNSAHAGRAALSWASAKSYGCARAARRLRTEKRCTDVSGNGRRNGNGEGVFDVSSLKMRGGGVSPVSPSISQT